MTPVSSNTSGLRRVFLMLGLMVALAVPATVSAHTVQICWRDSGGVTTFYAGTYHNASQAPSPTGGIIVDGFTYPFTGWIAPSALPSDAGCYSHPTYQLGAGGTSGNPDGVPHPGVRHFQTFTSFFPPGSHSIDFTTTNAIVWPWGPFPNLTFGGAGCADADFDGLCNNVDPCPLDFSNDADNDGYCADVDNCPLTYNPNQADANNNGQGDVCEGVVCGNGLVQGNEQCDDGNNAGGDGCSGICTIESVPPTCTAAGSSPYNVTVGTPLSTGFIGDDAGGGSVTMALLSAPAAATITPTTGTVPVNATVDWTPTSVDFGNTYNGQVQVTNGSGGTATCPLTIVVAGNTPPVAEANGSYVGSKTSTTTVTSIGSSDSDGTISNIEWDCLSDGNYVSAGSTPGTFSCPAIPLGGTYTATVRVTDDQNAQSTDTATITVQNIGPTAEANGPYAVVPTIASVTISAAGSVDGDGGALTYAWDCDTSDGTSYTSGGTTVACTYNNSGTAVGSLQVCDPEGMCDTDGFTVVVNSTPVGVSGGPYAGDEGVPVTVDGSGAGDIDGTIVQWEWDCEEDGVFEIVSSSPTATCTYDDNDVYYVALRVTDDDGGVNTVITSMAIDNLAPVITAANFPSAPTESIPASFSGRVGGHDREAQRVALVAVGHREGGHDRVQVGDRDHRLVEDVDAAVSSIANVAPTITSVVAPGTGDEGEALQFDVVSDDVGVADIPAHVATWDWGDGTSDTGASLTHAYIDQGTWTVTLTVDDQDGGTVSQTMTVVTSNVAPLITSTPPTNAIQGTLYTYQVVVTEPGDDVLEISLAASAPAGMTIDEATGLIEYTATYAQSLAGPYTVVISVTDNEGGVDGQVYTLNVLSADTDGDGIADDWETANGLDPNDSGDGFLDSDLDGLTNVEEFGLDQDPFTYDGPTAPVAVFPIGGEEVDTDRPDLTVDNATDPNGDFLTYEFEVYAEVALSTLVSTATGVVEDASGQTFWKIDVPLDENAVYWWRARANDGAVSGGWTATETFFVNTENEAPGATTLVWPVDGEATGSLTPTLEWTIAEDGDLDEVLYDVEIWDEAGENLVVSMTGVTTADGDINATWTVDVPLDEDTFYSWMVLPVDEHGMEGEWSDPALFFSDGTDEAPQGVAFIEPINNSSIVTPTPRLVATEGWDPEGTAVTYSMEVDTVGTFDSSDYESTTLEESGNGEIVWDLGVAGVTLPENNWIFARVQATDEGGVSSPPDTITFFVRGDNDAPPVPTLLSPEDGAESDDTTPTLTVETPVDPEADVVYVEFTLARDIDLDDVIGGVDSVLATGDSTGWVLDPPVNGTFYWSARAFDENGATSGWADPWLYTAPDEQVVGDDDDDDDGPSTGCDCNSSITGASSAPGLLVLLMLVPVLAVRRRR